ncbi:MAG: SUMF1/EgtB/PvdO family nonheme iron enzyme [Lentisphaeria bacterium]|nr:SUMF1/EgtB/PvdO family nonheme iron enzyme [Lentisphaeria bacterium]
MNEDEEHPSPEWDDDQKTLIYGMASETMLSPEELRRALGIPTGDRIQDYDGLSAIGIGGVGAVFSAHEPGLNREVALKILRPQYRNKAERIEWFIREARATAQIDHPNIPPVHRLGVFDDVGVYFTMKRVEGETLRVILRKLNEDKEGYRRTYTLHRLLEIFIGACNGVAFAHSHGILHCDLKPGNLMVGDYGEVLVMDWGMARYRADLDQAGSGSKMELDLECELDSEPTDPPSDSKVVLGGTPAFMPPEQLTGEVTEPAEAADVYGLGAILYTMLTWKTAPFDATLPSEEVMRRAVAGRIVPPRKAAPRAAAVPLELEAICMKAMARDHRKRYAKVSDLLHDIRNYLDGYPVGVYSPTPLYRLTKLIRRHPLIPSTLMAALLTWVGYFGFTHFSNLSQSSSLINLAEYNYTQAKNYNALALRTFNLLRERSEAARSNGRERELENELFRLISEQENGYNSALEFVSRATEYGLRESAVNRMCRDIFKSSLAFYLRVENYDAMQSFLRQARARWRGIFERAVSQDAELSALVNKIDNRIGTLEVKGEPHPGRRMTIRDSAGKIIWFGSAAAGDSAGPPAANLPIAEKLHSFELSAGNYLLDISLPSGVEVTAPVTVPVAGKASVELTMPDTFPPDVRYISGGEFFHGSSTGRFGVGKSPLPSFMIGANEVTFAEYLKFWNELKTANEKRRCLGWYPFDPNSEERRPIWNEKGELAPPFTPDLPVVGISGDAAEAYCAWLGKKLGLVCRLPTRLEWEKAARGVDGRTYVWGNTYEPGRALLRDNPRRKNYPAGAPPGQFPADVSVYGVFDLTGNVREFIRSPDESGRLYMVIGGSYATDAEQANNANVYYVNGSAGDLGFRYVLEVPALPPQAAENSKAPGAK